MGRMLPNENSSYGVNGIAEAMKWVSVVTSVVGMMTVPPLGGIWIDSLLGIRGVFVILGAIFGLAGGLYCLLDMVRTNAGTHRSR